MIISNRCKNSSSTNHNFQVGIALVDPVDYHAVLQDRSSSAEQRIQAVFHILAENDNQAASSLISGLKHDPSPIVRHECAYCLGELPQHLGDTALQEAIMSDPNPFVVHEAGLALANQGNPASQTVLESMLKHVNHDVVLTGSICLQRLEDRLNSRKLSYKDATNVILDLSSREEDRIQSSFILMEEGSEQSVELLIQALHEETDPIVKHEIIFSLGETASSQAIPHLIEEMLQDPNPFVKHEAALALGTLGFEEAKAPITSLLSHPNPDISESAAIALERLRSE